MYLEVILVAPANLSKRSKQLAIVLHPGEPRTSLAKLNGEIDIKIIKT